MEKNEIETKMDNTISCFEELNNTLKGVDTAKTESVRSILLKKLEALNVQLTDLITWTNRRIDNAEIEKMTQQCQDIFDVYCAKIRKDCNENEEEYKKKMRVVNLMKVYGPKKRSHIYLVLLYNFKDQTLNEKLPPIRMKIGFTGDKLSKRFYDLKRPAEYNCEKDERIFVRPCKNEETELNFHDFLRDKMSTAHISGSKSESYTFNPEIIQLFLEIDFMQDFDAEEANNKLTATKATKATKLG